MSAPTVPALNNSEVVRDVVVQIKIAGVYTSFAAVTAWDPTTDDANMAAENRFSDAGYSRSNKTGTGWSASMTVSYAGQVDDPTSLDVALQYVLDNYEGALGSDSTADIRWFDYNPSANSPRDYARQGLATVAVKINGGAATDNKSVTVTFTGQGKLNKIAHPYPLTAAVPVVEAVKPTTASHLAGTPLTIYGAHFTGTTGVTVGGVACTQENVNDDGELVVIMGAGTAGTGKAIVVTNGAGASSGGATVDLS